MPQAWFRPPQPLVSTTVVAPVAAAVRTPCTTRRTPRPSYRWVRLPSTRACLSVPSMRIERIVPDVPDDRRRREPGHLVARQLGDRLAQQLRGAAPARAEHQRDVVRRHPGRPRDVPRSGSCDLERVGGRVVQRCDVAHDRRLTRWPGCVRAAEWFPVSTPSQESANPRVVVVGGGPGGYEAALVGRRLGADVTVVEAAGLGGAAVLTDVVPSKTLIATAEWMTIADRAPELGIRLDGTALEASGLDLAAAPHRPRGRQHARQGARGRAVRGHPGAARARGRADRPRPRPPRRSVAGARHHPRGCRRPDARRGRRPRRDRRHARGCSPRPGPTASASSRGRSCTTCPSCPRS